MRHADAKIEAGLEWLRFTHPVSEHFAAQVRRTDLSGKRLAAWMHLLPDTILTVMPFVEAGVSVRVGACNPDSTDPRVVDYLARRGIEVFDGRREPRDLYDGTLRRRAASPQGRSTQGRSTQTATWAASSSKPPPSRARPSPEDWRRRRPDCTGLGRCT